MSENYFFRCTQCLLPNTKPDLELQKGKKCGACNYTEYYNKIDWKKRESELKKLCDKFNLEIVRISPVGKLVFLKKIFPSFFCDEISFCIKKNNSIFKSKNYI